MWKRLRSHFDNKHFLWQKRKKNETFVAFILVCRKTWSEIYFQLNILLHNFQFFIYNFYPTNLQHNILCILA